MRARLLTAALVGVIAVGWCDVAGAAQRIAATDNAFAPKTATVSVGDVVTWTNRGAIAHEVTAVDGSFASGNIDVGKSFTFTASRVGAFDYYCRYHGTATTGMTGALRVVPAGAAAVTPLPKTGGGREVEVGIAVLLVTGLIGVGLRLGRRAEAA